MAKAYTLGRPTFRYSTGPLIGNRGHCFGPSFNQWCIVLLTSSIASIQHVLWNFTFPVNVWTAFVVGLLSTWGWVVQGGGVGTNGNAFEEVRKLSTSNLLQLRMRVSWIILLELSAGHYVRFGGRHVLRCICLTYFGPIRNVGTSRHTVILMNLKRLHVHHIHRCRSNLHSTCFVAWNAVGWIRIG